MNRTIGSNNYFMTSHLIYAWPDIRRLQWLYFRSSLYMSQEEESFLSVDDTQLELRKLYVAYKPYATVR